MVDAARGSVLIVEDEPHVREVVARMLALRCPDATILAAETAKEGLAILVARRVDVLLTDHHLPDMTGLRLAQLAKEARPRLRIAMMAGEPDEGLAVAASRSAGVERFFVKPLDFEPFARAVAAMLRATSRDSSSAGSSRPRRLA